MDFRGAIAPRSCGPHDADTHRRVATFVDKILTPRGRRPKREQFRRASVGTITWKTLHGRRGEDVDRRRPRARSRVRAAPARPPGGPQRRHRTRRLRGVSGPVRCRSRPQRRVRSGQRRGGGAARHRHRDSRPPGIDCGATCSASHESGTRVIPEAARGVLHFSLVNVPRERRSRRAPGGGSHHGPRGRSFFRPGRSDAADRPRRRARPGAHTREGLARSGYEPDEPGALLAAGVIEVTK